MKLKNKYKILFLVIIFIIVGIIITIVLFNTPKNNSVDNTNDIIGLWDIDGNTKYEFSENGIGKLIVPLSEYEFSYTITDDTLSIDFKNENSIDSEYIYKLENNILKITDKNDKSLSFKLTKVKN